MRIGTIALCGFGLLWVGACGETKPVCTPKQSITCVGPGACSGTQTCNAEGTGYSACACGAPPDSSVVDATNDSADGANDAAIDAPEESLPDAPPFDAGITAPWAFVTGKSLTGIAVDTKQNVIVSGNVVANRQFYIAKFDSAGTLKWSKTGSSGSDTWHGGWAVAVDPTDDSVYAASYTTESMDVGGGTLGPGGYIVKWDDAGTFKWQRGGYAAMAFWCAGTKSNGNIVVAGDLSGSVDFGNGTMTSSSNDAVMLEISSSNGFVREKKISASSGTSQLIRTCAVDKSDNVIVGEWFDGTIDFGGGSINGPSGGSGSRNLAVGKFDSSFGYLYGMDFKTTGSNAYLEGLATDSSGNVYLAGRFDNTINMGGGSMNPASGTTFFGKLNSSLGHVWSKQFVNLTLSPGPNVAPDPFGNVLLVGAYTTSPNLGCGALPSSTNLGAFAALFNSGGTCTSNWSTKSSTGHCSLNVAHYLISPDFAVTGGIDTATCNLPSGGVSGGPAFVARLKP